MTLLEGSRVAEEKRKRALHIEALSTNTVCWTRQPIHTLSSHAIRRRRTGKELPCGCSVDSSHMSPRQLNWPNVTEHAAFETQMRFDSFNNSSDKAVRSAATRSITEKLRPPPLALQHSLYTMKYWVVDPPTGFVWVEPILFHETFRMVLVIITRKDDRRPAMVLGWSTTELGKLLATKWMWRGCRSDRYGLQTLQHYPLSAPCSPQALLRVGRNRRLLARLPTPTFWKSWRLINSQGSSGKLPRVTSLKLGN